MYIVKKTANAELPLLLLHELCKCVACSTADKTAAGDTQTHTCLSKCVCVFVFFVLVPFFFF